MYCRDERYVRAGRERFELFSSDGGVPVMPVRGLTQDYRGPCRILQRQELSLDISLSEFSKSEIERVFGGVPDKVSDSWLCDIDTLTVTEKCLINLYPSWQSRLQDQALMASPPDTTCVMSFHGEGFASINMEFSHT
ncbi:MAG: hypothetical protein IPM29_27230 [Planctomycetes bacterium]|nr:hypothetical protein [Planctomycetota bacterium]